MVCKKSCQCVSREGEVLGIFPVVLSPVPRGLVSGIIVVVRVNVQKKLSVKWIYPQYTKDIAYTYINLLFLMSPQYLLMFLTISYDFNAHNYIN